MHRRKVQRLPEGFSALDDRQERPAPFVGEEIVRLPPETAGQVNPLVAGSSPARPTNTHAAKVAPTAARANPRRSRLRALVGSSFTKRGTPGWRGGWAVSAIRIAFLHGLCEFDAPYSESDHVMIPWGGVLAQLAVAVPILMVARLSGEPDFGYAGPLVAFLGPFN